MRAGKMDRLIVIEQAAGGQDSAGAPTETWTTFATLWAARRDLRGTEFFAGRAVDAKVETVFRVRWIAGLGPAMRINDSASIYDITGIAEIGRRKLIEITCSRAA